MSDTETLSLFFRRAIMPPNDVALDTCSWRGGSQLTVVEPETCAAWLCR